MSLIVFLKTKTGMKMLSDGLVSRDGLIEKTDNKKINKIDKTWYGLAGNTMTISLFLKEMKKGKNLSEFMRKENLETLPEGNAMDLLAWNPDEDYVTRIFVEDSRVSVFEVEQMSPGQFIAIGHYPATIQYRTLVSVGFTPEDALEKVKEMNVHIGGITTNIEVKCK